MTNCVTRAHGGTLLFVRTRLLHLWGKCGSNVIASLCKDSTVMPKGNMGQLSLPEGKFSLLLFKRTEFLPMGKIRVTGHRFRDNFHCFSFREINYTYRKIKYSYHLLQKGKEIKKYISTQRTLLAKDLDESEFCRSQQEGSCYEGPQGRKNQKVCENKGRYSGSIDTIQRNRRGTKDLAQGQEESL